MCKERIGVTCIPATRSWLSGEKTECGRHDSKNISGQCRLLVNGSGDPSASGAELRQCDDSVQLGANQLADTKRNELGQEETVEKKIRGARVALFVEARGDSEGLDAIPAGEDSRGAWDDAVVGLGFDACFSYSGCIGT